MRGEARDVVFATAPPADREPVVALDLDVAEALRLERLDRRALADEEASSGVHQEDSASDESDDEPDASFPYELLEPAEPSRPGTVRRGVLVSHGISF